jgi:hypothetical protein
MRFLCVRPVYTQDAHFAPTFHHHSLMPCCLQVEDEAITRIG